MSDPRSPLDTATLNTLFADARTHNVCCLLYTSDAADE